MMFVFLDERAAFDSLVRAIQSLCLPCAGVPEKFTSNICTCTAEAEFMLTAIFLPSSLREMVFVRGGLLTFLLNFAI